MAKFDRYALVLTGLSVFQVVGKPEVIAKVPINAVTGEVTVRQSHQRLYTFISALKVPPYCQSEYAVRPENMKIGSIVIRCYEFHKMLVFWQNALHYVPREPASDGWVVLRDPAGKGPNISLDRIGERRVGKRSRLHLDLYTHDQESEVERLVKIGARRYPWRYRPGDDFVVLADPDDNLFCVVRVNS